MIKQPQNRDFHRPTRLNKIRNTFRRRTPPGVIPFWAFLERVERIPLAAGAGGGASRTGPRERRLSSVRNTVGAVASLSNVSTPLGRARAWIRQCLVCKSLEACVAALLDQERLVKVRWTRRKDEGRGVLVLLGRFGKSCKSKSAVLLRLFPNLAGVFLSPCRRVSSAVLPPSARASCEPPAGFGVFRASPFDVIARWSRGGGG